MLKKRYDPKEVEEGKYAFWQTNGLFQAGDLTKPPFSMVIPPPNVTGKLHLGHALDNTPQDIAARYMKLTGHDVLWLPGVDHAGIATQAKVEEVLRKEGLTKQKLGREGFIRRVFAWKKEHAEEIHAQWAALGLMIDHSRERFTLDEGFALAVRKVFKSMYDEGLIYRGERIINVDPVLKTALSNIEVVYEEQPGKLYYFTYKVKDSKDELIIATTRPETMFGDVAVFVNPKDERYQQYIGREVINPVNGAVLPILADAYVDKTFGSGVMKCTPAHDPHDFELAQKYGLRKILCLDLGARMLATAGCYEGLDRLVCRKRLVEELKSKGHLLKIEDIVHSVGLSERSKAVIEPLLSKQWFIKMKPLAELALKESTVVFQPTRFKKVFEQWMNNAQDWCISRQLWWGHQIPAWYDAEGHVRVSEQDIKEPGWHQDEDVLDTWFSSALWPFVTLGWPKKTEDLERYYPLSMMSTGYDIIFFWVARMIFQGLKFTKKSPFAVCLIHGLIRDEQGRKMSKSLGNGVDPKMLIDRYGADALRYYLTTCSTPGQDSRYSEEKLRSGANYLNKVWNTARYLLGVLDDGKTYEIDDLSKLGPLERHLLKRLDLTIKKVKTCMDEHEYSLACLTLHDFVYDDFASSHLEFAKVALKDADEEKAHRIKAVLLKVLRTIIIMLHPFAPFITEEIYQALPSHLLSIMLETYPTTTYSDTEEELDEEEEQVETLIKMISDIRAYKIKEGLPPGASLKITLKSQRPFFPGFISQLQRFSFASEIILAESIEEGVRYVYPTGSMFLASGLSKEEEELKRKKDLLYLQSEIARCDALLLNENFLKKAAPEKIRREQKRKEELLRKLAELG